MNWHKCWCWITLAKIISGQPRRSTWSTTTDPTSPAKRTSIVDSLKSIFSKNSGQTEKCGFLFLQLQEENLKTISLKIWCHILQNWHEMNWIWNLYPEDREQFLVPIKTYQFVHIWRLLGGLQEYILVPQLQRLQKSSCRWCTLHILRKCFLWIALTCQWFIKSKLWSLFGKCIY